MAHTSTPAPVSQLQALSVAVADAVTEAIQRSRSNPAPVFPLSGPQLQPLSVSVADAVTEVIQRSRSNVIQPRHTAPSGPSLSCTLWGQESER